MNSIIKSQKPIMITDKGKNLVKIFPADASEQSKWLGCMKGTGKILDDIIQPVEKPENWEVLSK